MLDPEDVFLLSGWQLQVFHIQIFWIKYDLGQKYYAPQVQSKWDSNS